MRALAITLTLPMSMCVWERAVIPCVRDKNHNAHLWIAESGIGLGLCRIALCIFKSFTQFILFLCFYLLSSSLSPHFCLSRHRPALVAGHCVHFIIVVSDSKAIWTMITFLYTHIHTHASVHHTSTPVSNRNCCETIQNNLFEKPQRSNEMSSIEFWFESDGFPRQYRYIYVRPIDKLEIDIDVDTRLTKGITNWQPNAALHRQSTPKWTKWTKRVFEQYFISIKFRFLFASHWRAYLDTYRS